MALMEKGHECPECREEEPIAPILFLGLGGMLAFFSFAFWIVTFVAEPGMLPLAAGMTVVGGGMMAYGWYLISQRKKRKLKAHQAAVEKAKCDYCGGQNDPGTTKCQFCGAPLF
ncbi:MAG: hypothetical protein A4E32_00861 [Methanomassiliicoccales archaeon PtaU1.Bin124]|nr:MAG: hypothetical protein A4E32_00861 [Methanomassiliicoccales archaeon PtaU1.Bin124]